MGFFKPKSAPKEKGPQNKALTQSGSGQDSVRDSYSGSSGISSDTKASDNSSPPAGTKVTTTTTTVTTTYTVVGDGSTSQSSHPYQVSVDPPPSMVIVQKPNEPATQSSVKGLPANLPPLALLEAAESQPRLVDLPTPGVEEQNEHIASLSKHSTPSGLREHPIILPAVARNPHQNQVAADSYTNKTQSQNRSQMRDDSSLSVDNSKSTAQKQNSSNIGNSSNSSSSQGHGFSAGKKDSETTKAGDRRGQDLGSSGSNASRINDHVDNLRLSTLVENPDSPRSSNLSKFESKGTNKPQKESQHKSRGLANPESSFIPEPATSSPSTNRQHQVGNSPDVQNSQSTSQRDSTSPSTFTAHNSRHPDSSDSNATRSNQKPLDTYNTRPKSSRGVTPLSPAPSLSKLPRQLSSEYLGAIEKASHQSDGYEARKNASTPDHSKQQAKPNGISLKQAIMVQVPPNSTMTVGSARNKTRHNLNEKSAKGQSSNHRSIDADESSTDYLSDIDASSTYSLDSSVEDLEAFGGNSSSHGKSKPSSFRPNEVQHSSSPQGTHSPPPQDTHRTTDSHSTRSSHSKQSNGFTNSHSIHKNDNDNYTNAGPIEKHEDTRQKPTKSTGSQGSTERMAPQLEESVHDRHSKHAQTSNFESSVGPSVSKEEVKTTSAPATSHNTQRLSTTHQREIEESKHSARMESYDQQSAFHNNNSGHQFEGRQSTNQQGHNGEQKSSHDSGRSTVHKEQARQPNPSQHSGSHAQSISAVGTGTLQNEESKTPSVYQSREVQTSPSPERNFTSQNEAPTRSQSKRSVHFQSNSSQSSSAVHSSSHSQHTHTTPSLPQKSSKEVKLPPTSRSPTAQHQSTSNTRGSAQPAQDVSRDFSTAPSEKPKKTSDIKIKRGSSGSNASNGSYAESDDSGLWRGTCKSENSFDMSTTNFRDASPDGIVEEAGNNHYRENGASNVHQNVHHGQPTSRYSTN